MGAKGGLKSNDKAINDTFSYPIFCGINIQLYESNTKFDTVFVSNHTKINMQTYLAK